MALPETIKDIEARIIRPTSTDNAIVRFNGTTGQVQNSTLLIDDNGKIIAPRLIHSNSVSTDVSLSRIPSETEIAFETSSGNGADSVWLWRENWTSANYGVFRDNSADVIHVVGGGASKFQINLSNGNTGVHGSLTVDGDAQIEGTVTSPKFIGDLDGKANLLAIHNTITTNSTRSTSPSVWDGAVSGMSYVWGQRWQDTAISTDTGDWQLGLRPGVYTAGATELCMMIDGDYYAAMGKKVLHEGNYNNYAAAKSHTHSISQITWSGGENLIATGTNTDWSIDMQAATTGSSFHIWSGVLGNSCMQFYNDTGICKAPYGVYGGVWNDYAEYRDQEEEVVPGYCVRSQRNGKLLLTTERLSPCDGVVSDTFGFAIGETEDNRTPIAVSGKVLVYVDGDRESYEIGDCLCAGPGGLAYKMSREEIKEYPDRIIGTVSEIPQYKVWGTGEVEVNNRIWINIK